MKPNSNNIETIRHSLAHVMAQAVNRLYKEVKQGVGPAIENGFYQDFDIDKKITPEDLPKIEKEMVKIISEDLEFEKIETDKDGALEIFKYDPYKTELIKEMEDDKVIIYKSGEYQDLCKGPHVKSTGELKKIAYKLNKLAGAYWRGNEKNPMLQRVYGIAFETPKELRQHIANLQEAEKRDHRKLGKELDLFSFARGSAGLPGSAYWHPRGTVVYNEISDYMRKKLEGYGYGEIRTPIIFNRDLWEKSGHWDKFKENMYFASRLSEIPEIKTDDEGNPKPKWGVKPMNCPGMIAGIYNSRKRSYKEFPLKLSEFGIVHRYEEKGVLHGLFRVRMFTQDDAHVFCTKKQMNHEIKELIELTLSTYKDFGFDKFNIELSTRPEKYIGDLKDWDVAEKTLENALKEENLKYSINEGDGAFYGPKIDFHIEDAIGRSWQLGTIQLDFSMPKNFDAKFIDEDGEYKTPTMLHRAIFGSLERFIGILTEHFAGAFPLWFSPVQVNIIPVSDQFIENAKEIENKFKENNIRTQLDDRNESVGKKISDNIKEKNPYAVVIGEKEIKSGKLAIRRRGEKKIEEVKIDDFIDSLLKEIQKRV